MKTRPTFDSIIFSAKRILVASNEPWATYHSAPIAIFYPTIPVIHVIPDADISPNGYYDSRAIPLSFIEESPDDILLLSGAEAWPVEVRKKLSNTRSIAIRLAYLNPYESTHDINIDLSFAISEDHRQEMEGHFPVSHGEVSIEAYPWISQLPVWSPNQDNILLVSSVSNNGMDGGSAGKSNDVLFDVADCLKKKGINFSISLHPREPVDRWEEFDVTSEGTLFSASKSSLVIAVTGTVIESIYQMGVPLALIPVPIAPAYLYQYGQSIHTVNDAMEFVAAIIPESLLVPQ